MCCWCSWRFRVATAAAAARAAHSAGLTVILNASPAGGDEAELSELAELIDVLVVNETEAAQWVWPVPHRVTTLGARGAGYIGGDGTEFTVPAPAVDPVDTSGAGDVFAGVLAAGWTEDREQALRRACAAGALATLVSGAGDCAPYADAIDDATLRGLILVSPSRAAAIALALLIVFGLLGFGWRAWLQRRRTGSFGFHGVSGRIGSVEWIAGVGFVVAMAVAGLGPLLQLVGVVAL